MLGTAPLLLSPQIAHSPAFVSFYSLGTQPSCLLLFPLLDSASSPPLIPTRAKLQPERAQIMVTLKIVLTAYYAHKISIFQYLDRACVNVET